MKRAIIRFWRRLKEPIAKKELLNFIREGLLISFVFAAMLGALRFLIIFTPFSFLTLFTFIIFYLFLIKRLRASFNFYHIAYSILAVGFLLLGDYVMSVSSVVIEYLYVGATIKGFIFNPIYHFSFLFNWSFDVFQIILNLLNIFIYGIIIYFTYQRMK